MAEVAGVAVGVLALIGSFRDCIDLFSCFVAARSLGRDYEILSAKLDIEKALLLQWADRTNLLKPHYDKRLDDPDVRAIVARIMSNIELLLGDSQVLQQRYGLHAMKDRGSNSMFSSLSQKRMFSLTKEFGKLDFIMKEFEKLDLRIDGYRSTSYKSKARWAIRDKNKFGELLQELSFFVSKLNDLVPDSSRAIHKMTAEDLSTLRSMETLRLVSEAASGRRSHVMDMAEDSLVRNCEQRILRCIWFRLMDDRRDSLPLPNPKTFEWAIEQSDASLKWDDLPDWLEGGTGLYWVCGKGKSAMVMLSFGERFLLTICSWQWQVNSNEIHFVGL